MAALSDLVRRPFVDVDCEEPQLVVEGAFKHPAVSEEVQRANRHQRDSNQHADRHQHDVVGFHALAFAEEDQFEKRPTEQTEQQHRHEQDEHREGDGIAVGGKRPLCDEPAQDPAFGSRRCRCGG